MSTPANLELSTWIRRRILVPDPKFRLFCFPHAGGGASIFRLWHKYLPPSIEVCPVQFPGREGRIKDEPFTDITKLVDYFSEIIAPLLDKPFIFFGHSMGALIAFELSRSIRRKIRKTPKMLIVAALAAPHDPDQPPAVHHLPREGFVDYLRQLEGTPEEVINDPGLLNFFMPLLRADFKLYESYQYIQEVPLQCPISVYGGLEDDSVTEKSLEAWRDLTTNSFVKRMFPGDHYFIKEPSDLIFHALIEDLSSLLA